MNVNTKMVVEVEAFQAIDKTVQSSGNTGRVYLPKGWVGKKVKVLLLEDAAENLDNSEGKA